MEEITTASALMPREAPRSKSITRAIRSLKELTKSSKKLTELTLSRGKWTDCTSLRSSRGRRTCWTTRDMTITPFGPSKPKHSRCRTASLHPRLWRLSETASATKCMESVSSTRIAALPAWNFTKATRSRSMKTSLFSEEPMENWRDMQTISKGVSFTEKEIIEGFCKEIAGN